jgi:molybdopterin biosynthesis enzyme MoaB
VRRRTLVVNLPGSPRGAVECLDVVARLIPHAIATLRGEAGDAHPARVETA